MSMDSRLDFLTVWAKVGRAEHHIDTLEKEITAWIDTEPYRLIRKNNVDFTRYWVTLKVVVPPPLQRWSLITSDAIHNFRCALDHAVFAMAIFRTKTNPPPCPRKWSFPISNKPSVFKSAIAKFSELGSCELCVIERFQPYKRPHPRLPPVLRMLREFDDFDKHRLLHVAMAKVGGFGWEYWDYSTVRYALREQINLSEVVDGDEVGSLHFTSPAPNADPKFVADIVVTIGHSPMGNTNKRAEVADVLREMTREVRAVIENLQGVF